MGDEADVAFCLNFDCPEAELERRCAPPMSRSFPLVIPGESICTSPASCKLVWHETEGLFYFFGVRITC